ncbi:hypothetical protein [Lyngbya confervoides]|uniref:RNA polymerase subunit sigma n=1 Tax=Lyngbya confervoides BDU141951 TaxID=1574623 RepID=A0ABD4T9V1_9CYAN|nr:hypothetical protein [Lyngbya confervoides]MCM1985062.1 hypothetical protein [Lyngbya confervoides BDU141951]
MASDFDRGIMKFKGADRPVTVAVSSLLILGAIAALVWWSLHAAYVF